MKEAEALLSEARGRAPTWALPCFNLAALLDRQGRGAEAEMVAASCPAGAEPTPGRSTPQR